MNWIQLLMFLLFSVLYQVSGKNIAGHILQNQWSAKWLVPETSGENISVMFNRKNFVLNKVPASFDIHIASKTDYTLFVNGNLVDKHRLSNSHVFQTYNVAEYLQKDANCIAVMCVSHDSTNREFALLVQGNSANEEVVNSNESWKYYVNGWLQTHGKRIVYDYLQYPSRWQFAYFDDSNWKNAKVDELVPRLKPDNVADYKWDMTYFKAVPRVSGINLKVKNIGNGTSLIIPRGREVTLLLDADSLTSGMLSVITTKGRDAKITLTYAPSLSYYDTTTQARHPLLGDRNDLVGKRAIGYSEVLSLKGGFKEENLAAIPRIFRFVQIQILTGDQDLKIDNVGYYKPIPQNRSMVKFETDNALDNKVWNVGFNTFSILNNIYDSKVNGNEWPIFSARLFGIASLYLYQDIADYKKVIMSVLDAPDSYSLFDKLIVIEMIHDLIEYQKNDVFVADTREDVKLIIDEVIACIEPDSCMLLGNEVFWDRQIIFNNQYANLELVKSLHLFLAITKLEDIVGQYRFKLDFNLSQKNNCIKNALINKYWIKELGYFEDDNCPNEWNNAANLLAVYSGIIVDSNKVEHVLTRANAYGIPGEYYFYLIKTLVSVDYVHSEFDLTAWRNMVELNLTSFPGTGMQQFEDIHPHGLIPLIYFCEMVTGIKEQHIESDLLEIAPRNTIYKKLNVSFPYKEDRIEYELYFNGDIKGYIYVPDGKLGQFRYGDFEQELGSGKNLIK